MKTPVIILLCIWSLIFNYSCEKHECNTCLDEAIEQLKNGELCDNASVKEYLFLNAKVYVLYQGNCCCDYNYPVTDANCNELGRLSGFAGVTHINGVDFYKNAKFLKTIWHN